MLHINAIDWVTAEYMRVQYQTSGYMSVNAVILRNACLDESEESNVQEDK